MKGGLVFITACTASVAGIVDGYSSYGPEVIYSVIASEVTATCPSEERWW